MDFTTNLSFDNFDTILPMNCDQWIVGMLLISTIIYASMLILVSIRSRKKTLTQKKSVIVSTTKIDSLLADESTSDEESESESESDNQSSTESDIHSNDLLREDVQLKVKTKKSPEKSNPITIIGLIGNKNSGKDIIINYLVKYYDFVCITFADTELFRENLCEGDNTADNVWIRSIDQKIQHLSKEFYTRLIITDVKFSNEIKYITAHGGYTWKIKCNSSSNSNVSESKNESECENVFINTNSLKDFYLEINQKIKTILYPNDITNVNYSSDGLEPISEIHDPVETDEVFEEIFPDKNVSDTNDLVESDEVIEEISLEKNDYVGNVSDMNDLVESDEIIEKTCPDKNDYVRNVSGINDFVESDEVIEKLYPDNNDEINDEVSDEINDEVHDEIIDEAIDEMNNEVNDDINDEMNDETECESERNEVTERFESKTEIITEYFPEAGLMTFSGIKDENDMKRISRDIITSIARSGRFA